MSTAKRALKKQAAIAAITHGQPQVRKLPETLALTRSQVYSLNALNADEQRLTKEIQERQMLLDATRKARVEVLAEVGKTHSVSVDEIGSAYRYDGEKLFRPTENKADG